MIKYYNIAGLNIQMDTFGKTLVHALPYITNKREPVDIAIEPKKDDIRNNWPSLSEDMIEYLSTERDFYNKLLDFNGMRLHSSAIVVENKAYLFSASSGMGKSTHTKLWLDIFGKDAQILNDDKPAIRNENGIWFAYGTPWSGKYNISINKKVPIAGIAMIERGINNEIFLFSGKKAFEEVYKQVNRPKPTSARIKLMDLLVKLFDEVPVWKLKCNMEREAAIVSYEAMSGKKYKEYEHV